MLLLSSRNGRASAAESLKWLDRISDLGCSVCVLVCNVNESANACALMRSAIAGGYPLGHVLHAAGVLRDGLLRNLINDGMQAVFAPKAVATWHLHCSAATERMTSLLLFSSVAAAFGNAGQAAYAAANASLDALALLRRMHGLIASSGQLPLVTGVGMGAAALSEEQLRVRSVGSISLEQYASSLTVLLQLTSAHTATLCTVLPSVEPLLDALTDSPRSLLTELRATAIRVTATPPPSSYWASVSLMANETQEAHLETQVLREVRALTGLRVDTSTPLLEAGFDSLAVTELTGRLRVLTGLELRSTLLFERPTPRAIASHLCEQLRCSTAEPTAHTLEEQTPLQTTAARLVELPCMHPPSAPARRHRILFLHGMATSARLAETLLSQCGWLDSTLPFEFVLLDAPHTAEGWVDTELQESLGLAGLIRAGVYDPMATQRTWGTQFKLYVQGYVERHPEARQLADSARLSEALLPLDEDRPDGVKPTAQDYQLWRETVAYVRAIAQTHGPFDGIAGFSEGAAAAYHLLCLQHGGEDVGLESVRFFVGMSPWMSPLHTAPTPLSIPFLATAGRNDHHMFTSQLPAFQEAFGEQMLVHEHNGKHVYPRITAELRGEVGKLLERLEVGT